jgi:hypothetical protein
MHVPKAEEVLAMIEKLASEDEAQRQAAQEALQAVGAAAIPLLNRAAGQPTRYSYVEVYRMLGIIGDTCSAKARKSLVSTMKLVAKSQMKSTPEEVREIAREALARWGEEVPVPTEPKVYHCHQCGRPSTEVTIRDCFLLDCRQPVCEDHAFKIEGGFGTWFCSEEHRQYALKNPSLLM